MNNSKQRVPTTTRTLKELKRNRLLKVRQEISMNEILASPIEKILEKTKIQFSAALASAISNDENLSSLIIREEKPNYFNQSKIFESEMIILSREEFEKIQRDLDIMESKLRLSYGSINRCVERTPFDF